MIFLTLCFRGRQAETGIGIESWRWQAGKILPFIGSSCAEMLLVKHKSTTQQKTSWLQHMMGFYHFSMYTWYGRSRSSALHGLPHQNIQEKSRKVKDFWGRPGGHCRKLLVQKNSYKLCESTSEDWKHPRVEYFFWHGTFADRDQLWLDVRVLWMSCKIDMKLRRFLFGPTYVAWIRDHIDM